jgi:hypothetical protein
MRHRALFFLASAGALALLVLLLCGWNDQPTEEETMATDDDTSTDLTPGDDDSSPEETPADDDNDESENSPTEPTPDIAQEMVITDSGCGC